MTFVDDAEEDEAEAADDAESDYGLVAVFVVDFEAELRLDNDQEFRKVVTETEINLNRPSQLTESRRLSLRQGRWENSIQFHRLKTINEPAVLIVVVVEVEIVFVVVVAFEYFDEDDVDYGEKLKVAYVDDDAEEGEPFVAS